jgi:hypothetical protein
VRTKNFEVPAVNFIIFSAQNIIIGVMKSKRTRWTGHVAHIHTVFLSGNVNGRDHLKDLGAEWKVLKE